MMWKLLFCLCLLSLNSFAKTLELKENSRSIFIPEIDNWELGRDLFGMPFIYFSPMENGQRSNISFTDTGASLQLDIQALAKSQDKFQKDKKEWAEQVGAKPLSFTPYGVKTNLHGHKIHRIGFNFIHEGRTYHEKSFYIECRGKLLFSKSLRLQENAQHEKDFSELLNSLDCGGV